MTKSVYLAGSMTGVAFGQANSWRVQITKLINRYSNGFVKCYSPMRYKEHCWSTNIKDEEVISAVADEQAILGSQRGLATRDRYDCLTSDLVFFNLFGAKVISQGTLIEVGLAASKVEKPLILLREKDAIHNSPMLLEYCQIHIVPNMNMFPTMEETYDHYLNVSARIICCTLCPE